MTKFISTTKDAKIKGPGFGGWLVIAVMAPVLLLLAGLWRVVEMFPSFRSAPDQPRGYSPEGIHKAAARSFCVFIAAALAGTVAPAPALAGGASASSLNSHALASVATAGVLAEKAPDGAGAWQENLAWILGLAILGLQLTDRLKPSPALHKQFADKDETEKYRSELKKMIEGVDKKLTQWSSDQYAARRRMHHRINAMQNALAFLAGAMEAEDNPRAAKFRAMIDKATLSDGGQSDE